MRSPRHFFVLLFSVLITMAIAAIIGQQRAESTSGLSGYQAVTSISLPSQKLQINLLQAMD